MSKSYQSDPASSLASSSQGEHPTEFNSLLQPVMEFLGMPGAGVYTESLNDPSEEHARQRQAVAEEERYTIDAGLVSAMSQDSSTPDLSETVANDDVFPVPRLRISTA